MPDNPNAIARAIKAAGGTQQLADQMGCTYQAIHQWQKNGWMPLARAKEVNERYPEVTTLRELVRADIAAAMDLSAQQSLLG